MARDNIHVNDRQVGLAGDASEWAPEIGPNGPHLAWRDILQLACARIHSEDGQNYLKAMAAAANFAWVNRSSMTFLCRQAFAKTFNQSPDDLDMQVIYDVSHNIAKVEEHWFDGRPRKLLVHRKGSTRAFPPHHPLIPVDYQFIGQPVLIGGTMGTCRSGGRYDAMEGRSPQALSPPVRVEPRVARPLPQLRSDGHRARHAADLWLDLPRRRTWVGPSRAPGRAPTRANRELACDALQRMVTGPRAIAQQVAVRALPSIARLLCVPRVR